MSTQFFPEIQIADALKCNASGLVFDKDAYFPLPGISTTCVVEHKGQSLCCYFNRDSGKLEMILDDRTGDLVIRV